MSLDCGGLGFKMADESEALMVLTTVQEASTSDPAVNVLRIVYLVVTKYAWIAIVLPGLFGNVMCIIVTLQCDNRRISTCNYMTALAVADSGVLIELAWGWRGLGSTSWQNHFPSEVAMQVMWYQAYSFGVLSGFFLAEMTVDRLIVVRFPMAAPRLCRTRRACMTIAVTFVLVCSFHVYMFFAYRYVRNEETAEIDEGPLRMTVPHAPELETFGNAVQLAVGTVLPFCLIVFCNVWIIVVLRRASHKQGKMGVSEKNRKTREKETTHLTRMLILVSIAYVVTSIPYRLFDIIIGIPEVKGHYKMDDEYWRLRLNCQHIVIIAFWNVNYGINFYLYCLGGGKKYRDDVKQRVFKFVSCCKS
ncbi:nociceptin receptor-like [Lineus longissimus]|uniref:nociceptin receptor-like n=1 Tax=Lineus longissimus TaxID=88925 RepID=UPI00315D0CF6